MSVRGKTKQGHLDLSNSCSCVHLYLTRHENLQPASTIWTPSPKPTPLLLICGVHRGMGVVNYWEFQTNTLWTHQMKTWSDNNYMQLESAVKEWILCQGTCVYNSWFFLHLLLLLLFQLLVLLCLLLLQVEQCAQQHLNQVTQGALRVSLHQSRLYLTCNMMSHHVASVCNTMSQHCLTPLHNTT